MHIVVIAVQNSQVNKKIVELNFGINNTLQWTIAILKCCDQCLLVLARINQSTHLHYHEPNHFISHSQMKLYIYQPEQN